MKLLIGLLFVISAHISLIVMQIGNSVNQNSPVHNYWTAGASLECDRLGATYQGHPIDLVGGDGRGP